MTRRVLLVILAGVVLLAGAPAQAQEDLSVRIRQADLDEDGTTRLVVAPSGGAVDSTLDAGSFVVTENGHRMEVTGFEALLESRSQPVAVELVIDISGSTQGEANTNAEQAAIAFVDALIADGVQVGLVAFGETAEIRSPVTTDRDALVATIESLEPGGETALYDALVLATSELVRLDAQRNIVVFSDGGDTVSSASIEDAVIGAVDASAPVTTVALLTDEFDPAALSDLSTRTGGDALTVTDAEGLSATFGQVAEQLASQYVLTYRSELTEPDELELQVSVAADGSQATDSVVVVNTRTAVEVPPEPTPVEVRGPLVGVLATPWGLYGGLGAVFVVLATILGVAMAGPASGSAERTMQRGLRHYGSDRQKLKGGRRALDPHQLAQRAAQLADRLPKPEGFEERLQAKIEQAGWPMRASEFLVIQAGAAIGTAAVAGLLTLNWIVAVVGLVAGWFIPRLVLAQRIQKRAARFGEQLPDTLQVLAGSLRAGYGLLQAVDTVVQEADDPTAVEFSRVLTEARLGMPLEDALEAMADRLDSEDFRWVVLAINIQKQIGGNLATLLDTVAKTLREREMVRRQIKTLSAEGRLSAVVLVALPFFLAIYMFFVNPEYVMLLFTRTVGLVMVVGALVLIAIGIVWIRKLIAIEV